MSAVVDRTAEAAEESLTREAEVMIFIVIDFELIRPNHFLVLTSQLDDETGEDNLERWNTCFASGLEDVC